MLNAHQCRMSLVQRRQRGKQSSLTVLCAPDCVRTAGVPMCVHLSETTVANLAREGGMPTEELVVPRGTIQIKGKGAMRCATS